MIDRRRNRLLERYTTPGEEIAFGGRKVVADASGLSSEEVNKNILSYNYSYPLHRDFKRPKHYNPYFTLKPREQVQCDLIDVRRLKNDNNNVQYILVCIDIFSKFAWVRGLTSKTAEKNEEALASILEDMNPLYPLSIVFDKGTEFLNTRVRQLLRGKNIKIFNPTSPSKAAYAERFNRTLQNLLYRYMTERQTNRYIDVLQNIVNTYNIRGHRSLNFETPSEAERDVNIPKIQQIIMNKRSKVILKGRAMKSRFKVGDRVRIKKEVRVFDRGYHETFSGEYFEVISLKHRLPVPTYALKSLNDDQPVEGDFYANELQLVQGDIWKVENVIKRRTVRGQRQVFVKWLNFDNQHNSWIPERDLIAN